MLAYQMDTCLYGNIVFSIQPEDGIEKKTIFGMLIECVNVTSFSYYFVILSSVLLKI